MTTYRIAFYKTLLNAEGMPFKCMQGKIAVPGAASPLEAATAAEREFERSRNICNWKLHADYLEIEPLPGTSGHSTRKRKSSGDDAHRTLVRA